MDIVLSHTTAFRYWCAFEGDISVFRRPRRIAAMTEALEMTPSLTQELADLGVAAPDTRGGGGESEPLHVLFADASLRKRSGGVVSHVFAGKLPSGALVQVGEHVLMCSPELAFVQMAEVFAPEREAFAGCELCASYGMGVGGSIFPRAPLTKAQDLQAFAASFAGERSRALAAVQEVMEGAACPAQAKAALMLTLPTTRGGYSLPKPKLEADGRLTWPDEGFAASAGEMADALGSAASFDGFAKRVGRGLGKYIRIRSAGFAEHHAALREQLGL